MNPDGSLRAARAAGKSFDTNGIMAQAQQEVAALNAQLRAAGLRFDGAAFSGMEYIGGIGGGQSANPRSLAELLAGTSLPRGIQASDARVPAAIANIAGGAGPTLSDSVALFATARGNLAGSGTTLDDDERAMLSIGLEQLNVATGRQAMRGFRLIGTNELQATAPRFLLVGPARVSKGRGELPVATPPAAWPSFPRPTFVIARSPATRLARDTPAAGSFFGSFLAPWLRSD